MVLFVVGIYSNFRYITVIVDENVLLLLTTILVIVIVNDRNTNRDGSDKMDLRTTLQ